MAAADHASDTPRIEARQPAGISPFACVHDLVDGSLEACGLPHAGVVVLAELAGEANARQRAEMLAKKLDVNKEDLFVSCTYDGIRTADGKLDIDSSAFDNDTLEFQWTLRTGDSESSRVRRVGKSPNIFAGHVWELVAREWPSMFPTNNFQDETP